MRPSYLRPGGLRLTEQLVTQAQLPIGALVVDLGCGAGDTVDCLRQLGYQAMGIDIALPCAETPHLRTGDMTNMGFADQSVAAVMAQCSLSVCGNIAQALAESHRILKPGGQLLISDVFFKGNQPPHLSLGAPADWDNWCLAVKKAGFSIEAVEDVSWVWKPFVAQCIWAEVDLSTLWCGFEPADCAHGGYQMGYFLLQAEKQ